MDIKLEKKIKESGNNLHLRITKVLENLRWNVNLSAYYYDDTTNKPREIDIIAEKEIPVTSAAVSPGGMPIDKFKVFLFIECKHFKGEIAFRMHERNSHTKAQEEKQSAIIMHGINTKTALKNMGYNHHYLIEQSIAKLYDSVDEDNNVFNAITQAVKSLAFFKERHPEKGLYYPIVVYSGLTGLYKVESDDLSKLTTLQQEKCLILGLNYSYRSVISGALTNQYFLIDFIHEDNFINYLNTISNEAAGVQRHLAISKLLTQNKS